MSEILVDYYSRADNTEKLAKAVAEGVRSAGGNPSVKPVDEADVNELPKYDGVIAAYYGMMAADLKKFFDDSVVVRKKMVNKVGAAFTTGAHRTGERKLQSSRYSRRCSSKGWWSWATRSKQGVITAQQAQTRQD